MMQTVQFAIADGMYAAALREALSRSCAWRVESVGQPDFTHQCVMVLDQAALERLPLPLTNPERIVLITHGLLTHRDARLMSGPMMSDPMMSGPLITEALMAGAWEAGIVSVVSEQDPIGTVLLAIMAAGLRVDKPHGSLSPRGSPSGISPTAVSGHAPLPPEHRNSGSKRCKTQ